MKLELSQQILGKHLNVKFYENPLSGSTVLLCRWMDGWMDGWTGRHTEMTKLRVTFHNSVNTPKNEYLCSAVGVQN